MKPMVTLCLALAISFSTAAQENPATANKPAAATQTALMPMAKPSPEIRKLIASFAGNWTGTMTTEPFMGMPGGTSHGPARFHAGPGSLSLVEDVITIDDQHHRFVGQGVIWWDATANAYNSLWCDSSSPSGCQNGGTGKWEGSSLVFNGTFDMMGKQYTMKETYSDFSPDGFNFVMEAGEGSSPMQKMFTVEYKKAVKPAK